MITVFGDPAPKGSWRAYRSKRGKGVRFVNDNPRTKGWEANVRVAARSAGSAPRADVPVRVRVLFKLRRPDGHFGARGLKKSAPAMPSVKPDIDKLLRSTLDALKGIAFADDARVVEVSASKVYAERTIAGECPGAVIHIEEVQP